MSYQLLALYEKIVTLSPRHKIKASYIKCNLLLKIFIKGFFDRHKLFLTTDACQGLCFHLLCTQIPMAITLISSGIEAEQQHEEFHYFC